MGSKTAKQRTMESELKKGMLRKNAPTGLLVIAFGVIMMMLTGSYLVKYFRGAV